MRNISNVDPSSSVRHEHSTRSPAKDFANELAKPDDERTHSQSGQRDGALPSPPLVAQSIGSTPPGMSIKPLILSDGKAGLPGTGLNLLTTANASGQSSVPAASSGASALSQSILQSGSAKAPMTTTDPGIANTQKVSDSQTSSSLLIHQDSVLGNFEWTAAQVQLSAVVQPTGVTEALLGSRVYGVHLLASTYLSELTTSPQAPSDPSDEAPPIMTPVTAVQSPETMMIEQPDRETEFASPGHNEIVAALALMVDDDESTSAGSLHSAGAVSEANAEASTALWPESSMRLTKQRDGSTVIWLRDYRTDNEDASRLVDAMVKGADERGMRLGRIVLNGREVWTSRENH